MHTPVILYKGDLKVDVTQIPFNKFAEIGYSTHDENILQIRFKNNMKNHLGTFHAGGCPRIGILFKIDEFSKNKHSHIVDIEVYAICEHYFLTILKRLGR